LIELADVIPNAIRNSINDSSPRSMFKNPIAPAINIKGRPPEIKVIKTKVIFLVR
jgi:hypothetical protein